MANDLFGREQSKLGGTFTPERGKLTIRNARPLVAQNLNLAYSKSAQELFDLSSDEVYVVEGRPRGRGSVGRVLGPVEDILQFHEDYGDICQMASNNMIFEISPGCGGDATTELALAVRNVLVQSVNITTSADTMLVSEQASFMFLSASPDS